MVKSWMAQIRRWHRWMAPFVLLPLLTSVVTGLTYRLARDWGGVSRDQAHWLMNLHEGEWLGPAFEPIVVLLNAMGVMWMLITGGAMLFQNLRSAVKTRFKKGESAG